MGEALRPYVGHSADAVFSIDAIAAASVAVLYDLASSVPFDVKMSTCELWAVLCRTGCVKHRSGSFQMLSE